MFIQVHFGKSQNFFLVDMKGKVAQISKLVKKHLARDQAWEPELVFGKSPLSDEDQIELLQIGPDQHIDVRFKKEMGVDPDTKQLKFEYFTE